MNVKNDRMRYDAAARKLLASLTLSEKVSLMSGKTVYQNMRSAIRGQSNTHYNHSPYLAGGIPDKKIPSMAFCDGPRGVVCGEGQSTCFPVPVLRGASFDRRLEERIGKAIAEEVMYYGGNTFAGICVNLPYHPGWGRCQEVYGEDSVLLGEMGAAMVRGVQSKGVIACIKHFAFNQIETTRYDVDVRCSKRTEREIFLLQFQRCIQEGAGAVMSSYNYYRGEKCGQSPYLLTYLLRDCFHFDGFVMSDFTWGIDDTVQAALAGQMIEMAGTRYYGDLLTQALHDGKVPESVVDHAALCILRTLLWAEATERKNRSSPVNWKAHRVLARKAAEEGITLIRNEGELLPLKHRTLRKIAVLGRFADQANLGDHGSSRVYPPCAVSAWEGISRAVSERTQVLCYHGSDCRHAQNLAAQVDVVIVTAGYHWEDEGEYLAPSSSGNSRPRGGGDRKNQLSLRKCEEELIQAVTDANPNTVVVLYGGGAITLGDWAESVAAILLAYYPGMEGGTALANILFGKANPSGKLPFVIPWRAEDLPALDWESKQVYYHYFHGYRKLEYEGIRPRYPFGFGLSYTTFSIDGLTVQVGEREFCASVWVENQGQRRGAQVVQLYLSAPHSIHLRAVKWLAGFERVELGALERRMVSITCPLEAAMWFDEETDSFQPEQTLYRIWVGSSSRDDLICTDVTLFPARRP